MSKINVNTWEPESGTALTMGATGDTITVPSGATLAIASGAGFSASLVDDVALLGFKVAVNGTLAKYNLVDQTEDAFVNQTGIDAGESTDAVWNSAKYFSGFSTPTASGGTISSYGLYTIHSFLSGVGTYTNDEAQSVDILIIAGAGGGAGTDNGGGGGAGAGGMQIQTSSLLADTSYTVTVGAGGAGATGSGTASGVAGSDSIISGSGFSTLTSTGGGFGGGTSGGAGGSGGGSFKTNSPGSGTAGQGNDGGTGATDDATYDNGGGGGGKGAVGANASAGGSGAGGAGATNDYRTGENVTYAGGGAGGAYGGKTAGSGGAGGGGVGAVGTGTAGNGTVNTGGGGGGGGAGGSGGSGIVVIRRLTVGSASNMVLQSNATTANDGAPTKGAIVMTYTNGAGTATLNTDLTAEFSANDGGAWTPMTLVAQGSTGTHLIVSAHDVTLATASGTAMRYRIKTFNQSASKETRIQAVSLGWN
jgi:hypothetical protein